MKSFLKLAMIVLLLFTFARRTDASAVPFQIYLHGNHFEGACQVLDRRIYLEKQALLGTDGLPENFLIPQNLVVSFGDKQYVSLEGLAGLTHGQVNVNWTTRIATVYSSFSSAVGGIYGPTGPSNSVSSGTVDNPFPLGLQAPASYPSFYADYYYTPYCFFPQPFVPVNVQFSGLPVAGQVADYTHDPQNVGHDFTHKF